MNYICGNSDLGIRRMADCEADYARMTKWLSDPQVLLYYEGRDSAYDREKVLEKFRPRVLGEAPVVPCVIEIGGEPAVYLQYYPMKSEQDCDFRNEIEMDFSLRNIGIDLFIAHDQHRGRGYGTEILRLLLHHLFAWENADRVYIDPQTWNLRAVRCYEKSGFRPLGVVEKRELHEGELRDSLIMMVSKADMADRA